MDATPTPPPDSYDVQGRIAALFSTSARFSLGRLAGMIDYVTLPPRSR